jgi:hypothetical protein
MLRQGTHFFPCYCVKPSLVFIDLDLPQISGDVIIIGRWKTVGANKNNVLDKKLC